MVDIVHGESITKIFESRKLFKTHRTIAVEDFDFTITEEKPEIMSIAGESGSGKTTAARLILGFIKPTRGTVYFRGKSIWGLNRSERKEYRRTVQAVFQDPYASFNTMHQVDHYIRFSLKSFGLAKNKEEIDSMAREGLEEVGLKYDSIAGKYPHQLSGGERQRVMVARAFALKPRLIIADEPVSMLDASIRANVLNIIKDLKERWKISFMYITHDLSTAYYISDRIKIMYKGRVVESGPARRVLTEPLHPYTKLLIESIPKPDPEKRWKGAQVASITESGEQHITKGCRFYPRCSQRMEKCNAEIPRARNVEGRQVECFLY